MVIQVVVNSMGVNASAGVGVAEKVCAFIMLVPSAFSQSMSAFVAQNIGAGYKDRALKALKYGILTSLTVALFIGAVPVFFGYKDMIFTQVGLCITTLISAIVLYIGIKKYYAIMEKKV